MNISSTSAFIIVKDLLSTYGLNIWFLLGLCVYFGCAWIDKNVSLEYKQVISKWLRDEIYKDIDLTRAIVATFDRIYLRPLRSWSAFVRSTFISLVAWLISNIIWTIIYPSFVVDINNLLFMFGKIAIVSTLLRVFGVILSDYFSLFIIRNRLLNIRHHLRSVISGSVWSILVIWILVFGWQSTIQILFLCTGIFYTHQSSQLCITEIIYVPLEMGWHFWGNVYMYLSAFLVSLWLPFFAISVLFTRSIHRFFRTVTWAQRFLEEGHEHPYRVIGVIAGLVVSLGGIGGTLVARTV